MISEVTESHKNTFWIPKPKYKPDFSFYWKRRPNITCISNFFFFKNKNFFLKKNLFFEFFMCMNESSLYTVRTKTVIKRFFKHPFSLLFEKEIIDSQK